MALTPAQIVSSLAPIVGRAGAAGIAGNLMQESSDNPADAGGGLAQWQGSRYTGLVKYAQSRGLPATSAQAALGYLAQDLKGPYSGLAQQLRQSTDPGHAAMLFSNIYERPGTPMLANRVSYARQALGATGGTRLPVSPGGTSATAPGGVTNINLGTGFNQQAFSRDQQRYIAGSYLKNATDPYAAGAPKTGLETGAASNPLITSGQLLTKPPDPAAYQTAAKTLQVLAGPGTPLNQHPVAFAANLKGSGYTNPLPGAMWGRTDMGVDATMKAGAGIKALGDSKVVNIFPNWYAGQPYVLLQLLNGPQAGKYYYVAEAINPSVHAGQTVRAGQTIGTYNPNGTGLELGWGTKGSQTLAQSTGADNANQNDHANTVAGKSFRNFLNGLGAGA